MSHLSNDRYNESLEEFCDEVGANPHHVMHDSRGAYVIVDDEFGSAGEESSFVSSQKVYLPDNLQDHA